MLSRFPELYSTVQVPPDISSSPLNKIKVCNSIEPTQCYQMICSRQVSSVYLHSPFVQILQVAAFHWVTVSDLMQNTMVQFPGGPAIKTALASATIRPAEIMPGIILACLGIRELCGNNRGCTGIIARARAYCARKVHVRRV